MKKTLYIIFFLIGTLHFAQGSSANPFEESEKDNNSFESIVASDNNLQKPPGSEQPASLSGGGNPGPDVSVDDYIPLLLITAFIIIFYKTRKNRNLLS